jgi:hypothetical protein
MMLIARMLARLDTWLLVESTWVIGRFDARLDTFALILLASATLVARMLAWILWLLV